MQLIEAIMVHDVEKVRVLLEAGANPNAVEDLDFITPLHFAVSYKCPEAAALLLRAGALPLRRNAEGYSALEYAVQLEQPEMVRLLRRADT